MKVMICGITGMLGSTLLRFLSQDNALDVYGTVRSKEATKRFPLYADKIIANVDAYQFLTIEQAYHQIQPDVVINCIGLVKQLDDGNNPLKAIKINAELPHLLSQLCKNHGSRLIHISTDCVFSGSKGNYLESDLPDAKDVYGRSKLLGEVYDNHALTIRTSIIGPEMERHTSLLDWFLSQSQPVKGFKKAIFSGLTTLELSKVIKDCIVHAPQLHGLYHVAADPINKYDLLQLVAKHYNKSIDIMPDESFVIDRSLNAERFNTANNYQPPNWHDLIYQMKEFSLTE